MTGYECNIMANVSTNQGYFHHLDQREVEFQVSTTLETYFDSFMDLMEIEERHCVLNA